MTRRWWLRRGAPSDADIRREIEEHVQALEAEELASGAAPDAARRRALERFGDREQVAAAMRRAWVAEPCSASRIALLMGASAVAAGVLFAISRASAGKVSMEEYLLVLPSILPVAIPLGAGVGAALVAAGRGAAASRTAPDRATFRRALAISAIATLVAFAAYLVVPASNARLVNLQRAAAGQDEARFPGVRSLGIPDLLALQAPDVSPPAAPESVASFTPAMRERLALIARFELQKRFALPLACIALALAGLACGAWLRRLRFAPALAVFGALAASATWYGIYAAAESRLLGPVAAVALLAWLPNACVIALAAVALAARRAAPG